MAVMQIGEMRMRVHQRLVPMLMRVRLAAVPGAVVGVTMMLVVPMRMRVRHRVVHMLVLVAFREVQPRSDSHERSGNEEREIRPFAEQDKGDGRPDEWRGRVIRARSRGPQMPQRDHEQGEAHAVSQKADNAGRDRRVESRWGSAEQAGEAEIDLPDALSGGLRRTVDAPDWSDPGAVVRRMTSA